MMEEKTVWFPLLLRPTPAALREWLEGEAREGWYPKIGIRNLIWMKFRKGTPEDCQYFFDFRFRREKEYERVFREFVWEKAGEFSNVVVWYRKRDGEDAPVYTDEEELKIGRRILLLHFSIFIPMIALTAVCAFFLIWNICRQRWLKSLYYAGLGAIAAMAAAFLGKAVRQARKELELK